MTPRGNTLSATLLLSAQWQPKEECSVQFPLLTSLVCTTSTFFLLHWRDWKEPPHTPHPHPEHSCQVITAVCPPTKTKISIHQCVSRHCQVENRAPQKDRISIQRGFSGFPPPPVGVCGCRRFTTELYLSYHPQDVWSWAGWKSFCFLKRILPRSINGSDLLRRQILIYYSSGISNQQVEF